MKKGNGKIQKVDKPKYSIKDYQDDNVVFDKDTQARIDATVAIMKAISKQRNSLNNGKNKIAAF
jgi:hypothetical protein